MPAIGIKIRYEGAVPGTVNLSQREFNNRRKKVWEDVGQYWFEHFRAKHFTKEGAKEYGYAPRSGDSGTETASNFWTSYQGRKQHKYHHTLPLKFSGELESASRAARITATNKGVKVAMFRATKALMTPFPKKGGGMPIDMADELTRVSQTEIEELTRFMDSQMQFELDSITTVSSKFYGAVGYQTTSVAGLFHAA